MEREEILKRVNAVKFWWHHLDLGQGIITPGHQGTTTMDGTAETLERLHLPDDLTGKTVLDVGAWDGAFSFAAEKRGANRVLATDHYVWHDERFGMDGFLTARELLGSKVQHKDIDVFDISPETVGVFDITLFLGVLYHLRNPLLALDRMAAVTRELIIVETHVVRTNEDHLPLMRFYEGAELNGDPTNWWGPNLLCLEQMVRSAGFREVRVMDVYPPEKPKRRSFRKRLRLPWRPKPKADVGRAVVFGYK
jgi:tRNA (mo5U34)-methyltransferase